MGDKDNNAPNLPSTSDAVAETLNAAIADALNAATAEEASAASIDTTTVASATVAGAATTETADATSSEATSVSETTEATKSEAETADVTSAVATSADSADATSSEATSVQTTDATSVAASSAVATSADATSDSTRADLAVAETVTQIGIHQEPVSQDEEPPSSPKNWRETIECRYEVSAISLLGLAFVVCVLQMIATNPYIVVRFLAIPSVTLFAIFAYEWIYYFSHRLTPRKKAFFDVKNILEKYQSRRDTEETRHFQPDPPTPSVKPGPPKKASAGNGSRAEEGPPLEDFGDWRTKYYDNEYAEVAMAAKTKRRNRFLFAGGQKQ